MNSTFLNNVNQRIDKDQKELRKAMKKYDEIMERNSEMNRMLDSILEYHNNRKLEEEHYEILKQIVKEQEAYEVLFDKVEWL